MNRNRKSQVGAIRIPIAATMEPTVHCKVHNRQTPKSEARQLHEDPTNKASYCFACGRSSEDYRCMK